MRRVIFNADDFGATEGINRAIIDCHERGPVTSTSLLVGGRAARDAAARAREHPDLAVGLHFDVRAGQLDQQLAEFRRLMVRGPTHLDSHHHVHRNADLRPQCEAAAARLGVPLRGGGTIAYVGGFYAQWDPGVTDLAYVSVGFLERLLAEEVKEGWTELSCHPGYVTPELDSSYSIEREAEVQTLTDPRVSRAIERLGIELVSFADHTKTANGGRSS
jgi:chitin disaccharide deacetylase